uniref:hypothetical protein n=1 Tax=Colpomenia sinuosa TaxID=87236 RepID=UPI003002936A|nr:hypothetical protein [Colpomenia sinuosa]
MFTPRKRHLRKKNLFLHNQSIFALINASNLKTSEITEIKLSLKNSKLYYVPLYLRPPKLGLGYPTIMIIYERVEDLKSNIPEIANKMECLGIFINKKWYSVDFLKTSHITNQNKKLLSLLLYKNKYL